MTNKLMGAPGFKSFADAQADVRKLIEELDIEERVISRLDRKSCGIDLNALKPGAYELNKTATGIKEVDIVGKGQRELRFSLDLVLEVRAKFRSGDYSYRMLATEYKINLKQLQQIMRGEFYTVDVKRRENLDVTGEPLSLKGKFNGRRRNEVNPRNVG
jgi:hypothetical protein